MARVPFTRFDAAGNTWIIVASRDLSLPPSPPRAATAWLGRLAKALCLPRRGPLTDGLAVILPPRLAANLARVRFFNADGSEPEMSGNGIRCAAFWLSEKTGRVRGLRLETAAGLRVVSARARDVGLGEPRGECHYIVRMGRPILNPAKIPFLGGSGHGPVVAAPLPTRHGAMPVTVTSMGNPHCTVFVGAFGGMNWKKLGREIERHPLFPNRTNVEFVQVLSRSEIEVHFWERGVGETRSSGTGSCAAVVAAVLSGRTGRRVRVRTRAGVLEVEWRRSGGVRLTGPVTRVRSGMVAIGGSAILGARH